MNILDNLLYTKSHEWVLFTSEDTCTVGISDYAQSAMGDIVFINLPVVGDSLVAGEALCDLESVKAVADVFSPVSGIVEAVNDSLDDAPEALNAEPYTAWIAQISGAARTAELMDADAYRELLESEGHI